MKRLAYALPLLLGSCNDTRPALQAISCRPHMPSPPVIVPVEAWSRKQFKIEPRGTYTDRHPSDGQGQSAPAPTSIDIAKDLKLSAGDFVGLQSYGEWFWGCYPNPSGPSTNRLGAVFVDAKQNKLAPARPEQQQPFETPPMYHPPHSGTDIDQDFMIPADKEVVVRVPAGAAKILFSVGDSAYGDNCTANDFGVTVFEPNRKSSERREGLAGEDADEPDRLLSLSEIERLLAGDLPKATSFSFSPFAAVKSPDAGSQWRGNYPGSGWDPKRSIYAGERNSLRHWGWDIFSPVGSPLMAPVWPSQVTFGYQIDPATHRGWGNYAAFAFRSGGRKYILLYAHLDRVEGGARRINGPKIVGYSGCSGLYAEDLTGCGKRFESGKSSGTRLDHVHVALIDGSKPGLKEGNACDPRTVLNWAMR